MGAIFGFCLSSVVHANEPSLRLKMERQLGNVDRVIVSADQALLSIREESVFSGKVELQYGERSIMADEVRYNAETGRLNASG
ncbi:MAG: hypothetical protein KJO35_01385, partial [Gammaproteobacteria bacterium]|nr:hypothetical protein [Gammaproteobacteria bacterium]